MRRLLLFFVGITTFAQGQTAPDWLLTYGGFFLDIQARQSTHPGLYNGIPLLNPRTQFTKIRATRLPKPDLNLILGGNILRLMGVA
jgi:hypothetical protein